MAVEDLLTRIIAQIGRGEAKNTLLSSFPLPSRDDVLHDGLVGSGNTLGAILGATAGYLGGQAIGGPRGGLAGSLLLEPLGALAGGWAAHGAYREGQLIGNILSQPENWTVDAAGAIVPVTPAPNPPSDTNESNDADARYLRRAPNAADSGYPPLPSGGAGARPATVLSTPRSLQSGVGTVGPGNGEPPVRFLSRPGPNPLSGGIAGWTSSVDPAGRQYAVLPAPPPQAPDGLLGMLSEYLRDNPNN